MQILSASQVHQWDEYTIENEPVSSIALMERAARACFTWLIARGYGNRSFNIFCGKGNNGGDGLAIARMLSQNGQPVIVNILEFGHKGTEDFQQNLAALHNTSAIIRFISTPELLHPLPENDVIIDAVFGSGLNRKPTDLNARVIEQINDSGCEIISIDIPSGISADSSSKDHIHVRADRTLTFERYKLAFLMAENEEACGEIHVLHIGLHPGFLAQVKSDHQLVDITLIKNIYKPRKKFAHKGSYGHALLIAGSHGKMGAAVLATNACLKSGVGLCTVHVPACGYEIMQIAGPEAMTHTDPDERVITTLDYETDRYSSIGIGPGLGQDARTLAFLKAVIMKYRRPMVIDADALNLLSANQELLKLLPGGSVITPHPKEFERLFGKSSNDFERIAMAAKQAKLLNINIVLKGHFTLVATPGQSFFNTTGNAGMASGGTGDTLTGIISGLLSQQYPPSEAAILGVYLHGLAGDLTAETIGKESLIASDLIANLGKAFLRISEQDA